MPKSVNSREVGLVAGLNLFHYFLGTDDLHYGYWEDDLELNIRNLPQAQKRYSKFLQQHIPADCQTILDVGCGGGGLAHDLTELGYQVEGVSPSELLSEAAKKNVGPDFVIYQGLFEQVEIEKKYDLVMFSESFQYIDLKVSLKKAKALLKPGGHILVCDFFRKAVEGHCVIGGGHKIEQFREAVSDAGLEPLEDVDITAQTAPNLDIVRDMAEQLLQPTLKLIGYTFSNNHPWISRLFRWKFRRKLEKIDDKYFAGKRNAEVFAQFKTYRLFLMQEKH